ncbi:hypothetical protein J6590_000864 [Homalodisca vitripennis]|nr:hypothetical protein J6590_000864 [Homalodisca vitripennis]
MTWTQPQQKTLTPYVSYRPLRSRITHTDETHDQYSLIEPCNGPYDGLFDSTTVGRLFSERGPKADPEEPPSPTDQLQRFLH